jgi:hypothetical protein
MDEQALKEHLEEITRIVGSESLGNLPGPLYELLRRYSPMPCVDGVPVLSDEPQVILSQRSPHGALPNAYWVVGGRIPKGAFSDVPVLKQKFLSELGITVDVSEADLIGQGRMHMQPGTGPFDSMREYLVNTPTNLYAVKLPGLTEIESQLRSGDGNERWRIFKGEEIARDTTLHPYVRNGSLVALDHIYGKEWRQNLPREFRTLGYPNGEELAIAEFLPVALRK